ncbi:MAG: thioesterase [Bacillota bacterium]|nr:thioesterase [Bacillota bacterium]
MTKVAEKEYEIHYYEIDQKRKALITTIIDFMQDITTDQSNQLGVGIDYLDKNNVAWVVYKWDVSMDRYPEYTEKIKIRTWAASFRKFYGYRAFDISGGNGEKIGHAMSTWFFINLNNRRPCKVIDEICEAYDTKELDTSDIDIEKIKAPTRNDSERVFHVRYSDIDTNNHVNNVKYISWALETVPMNVMLNYRLNRIIVNYEKEANYGEMVKSVTEVTEEEKGYTCVHAILKEDGTVLTTLKTIWR